MAPATTPTVKILTDLGYQVWEMETDADMLMALVEAINTLSITNPNDGRISILQRAVKGLRVKRRSAAPSQGQKYTVTRKRLKASKFTGTAKPAATSRVNPVALLPAASEDQSVFSTLVSALTNIGSLLKRIGGILRIQFLFKKLLAARQRRKDALDEKRKREGELESNSGGLGKRITNTLTKPIKSFWSTLLNFFKNIIFGSALIGFLKWMKDPENLKKIVDISTWFYKHGRSILITLGSLLALKLGFKIYALFNGVRKIIKVLKLGKLLKRIPWWKTAQTKAAAEGLSGLPGQKLLEQAIYETSGRKTVGPLLQRTLVSKESALAVARTGVSQPILNLWTKEAGFSSLADVLSGKPYADAIRDRGLRVQEKGAKEIVESSAQKKINKMITDATVETVAKAPTAVGVKGPLSMVQGSGTSGMEIMKMIGNPKALKKLLDEKKISKEVYDRLIKLGVENPKLGQAFTEGVASKLINPEVLGPGSKMGSKVMEKLGFWGAVRRTLPFISTGLDAVSAYEEFQKGNISAGLLFTGGALTSIVAPWWSLGLSVAGIAESVRADGERLGNPNYEDPLLNHLKNLNFAPNMSTVSLNDAYSIGTSSKKQQKIVLVPVNTGGGESNSTSDGSGTQVNGVSSTDGNNDNTSSSIYNYDLIGTL